MMTACFVMNKAFYATHLKHFEPSAFWGLNTFLISHSFSLFFSFSSVCRLSITRHLLDLFIELIVTKTKKIDKIFEKDNAMINAQINNISETIFEIAIQNSNQNSFASINASHKKFEIDVSFIEKIIFNFNEQDNEANQSSMNQMISYMIFEILTNVNITKSFSENNSDSIRHIDSNAIIIDQQHKRSNCFSHNFSKKLRKSRNISTFKIIKKFINFSIKRSRRLKWAQRFKTSIENWLYCNTMCTRRKI